MNIFNVDPNTNILHNQVSSFEDGTERYTSIVCVHFVQSLHNCLLYPDSFVKVYFTVNTISWLITVFIL
jgi:hypothetical protein